MFPEWINKMLTYISQLKPVDTKTLDTIAAEIQSAGVDWNEPYPEYASDGLKVATLLNPTGEQYNFDYHDCAAPLATPLLNKLPSISKFLTDSNLQIMGSRLLRLDPGTFLHEHRDFVYLQETQRLRLHLPIITNQQAFITSPGVNVHFKRGYLWKLDPKATIHSACNFGAEARIHLMLDCYGNPALAELLQSEKLDEDCLNNLPVFDSKEKELLLAKAQNELDAGNLKEAEETLLRSFCLFNLGQTTSYDLLFELFSRNKKYAERTTHWKARLKEVYMEHTAEEEATLTAV